jgi:hypothetical protein
VLAGSGGHLYTDPDLPDYGPASAQVTRARGEEFPRRLG